MTLIPSTQESSAERANRLLNESRSAGWDAFLALDVEIAALARKCAEVASIETLPNGIRDAVLKLGVDVGDRHEQIAGIVARLAR